jgi:hypothetical protein
LVRSETVGNTAIAKEQNAVVVAASEEMLNPVILFNSAHLLYRELLLLVPQSR